MKITDREMPASYWKKVADKNGIDQRTYKDRTLRGWPPHTAATQPKQAQLQKNSIASMARAAGHTPGLVTSRLRQGWTLEDALATPKVPPRGVLNNASAIQQARKEASRHARSAQCQSIDDAHSSRMQQINSDTARIKVAGIFHKSLAQKARDAGLKPSTVSHRLQAGWPLEKALSTPLMSSTESARRGGKARAAQKKAEQNKERQHAPQ